MLGWLEGEARAGRQRNLWVAASDFNTRARGFYAGHGFVEAATLDDLVTEGRAEILMRKRVA